MAGQNDAIGIEEPQHPNVRFARFGRGRSQLEGQPENEPPITKINVKDMLVLAMAKDFLGDKASADRFIKALKDPGAPDAQQDLRVLRGALMFRPAMRATKPLTAR